MANDIKLSISWRIFDSNEKKIEILTYVHSGEYGMVKKLSHATFSSSILESVAFS